MPEAFDEQLKLAIRVLLGNQQAIMRALALLSYSAESQRQELMVRVTDTETFKVKYFQNEFGL